MKYLIVLVVFLAGCFATEYEVNPSTGLIKTKSYRKFGDFALNKCVKEPVTDAARCEVTPDGQVCYGMKETCIDVQANGVDNQSATQTMADTIGEMAKKIPTGGGQ